MEPLGCCWGKREAREGGGLLVEKIEKELGPPAALASLIELHFTSSDVR